jgi:hypothetical protein
MNVSGNIAFRRLRLTTAGLGSLETRPVRYADVEVREAGTGTCYGATSTDASGDYALVVEPTATSQLEVVVFSRTDEDPLRRVTVHNALPPGVNLHTNANVFSYASPTFPAGPPAVVDLVVPYNHFTGDRPSIGFGVLDVALECSESLRQATSTVPPLCHLYTQLGNNGSTGTSFYSHGARAITILGGAAGNLDTSDTDYFDDPVIAHEYGHFIEFNLAHSLTRGGFHGGENLEPNFSWSEGQATGYGCLCLRDPAYIDSVGTTGGTQINASVENWPQVVRGIGSEESVLEAVWDLGAGANGISDLDGDVAAVSLGALYQALMSFDPQADAPYVGLLFDRLVSAGAISAGALDTMLLSPENQQIGYPLTGSDVWPIPLTAPGSVAGAANSMVANPCRGFDASRWYLFTITTTKTLNFHLAITNITPNDNNLDLYLIDVAGNLRGSSLLGGDVDEMIGPVTLGPGDYIVRVEANCGGGGNNAAFTLTVTE